ncbi:MAG: site-specific DNA-methyltransferase [Pseudomonadota bacterium]
MYCSDLLASASQCTLYNDDCRNLLPKLDDSSVHLVLTDPPYFLDGLDSGWRNGHINAPRATGCVGGLPVGMKFDKMQGKKLQKFLEPVAAELLRILKPGGFLLMFAAPRLYHRAAVAVEDAGFEIRDAFAWHFTKRAQFKAFKMDHFVHRRNDINEHKKKEIINILNDRMTPQLRPQFEAILCAQKPRDGTFIENWLAHRTGLIDGTQKLNGRVPETVMKFEKQAKDRFNNHLTPKPMQLCAHLIQIFSMPEQTVLDPFVGSGTTCLAANYTNRKSIGIDMNPDYIEITRSRLG